MKSKSSSGSPMDLMHMCGARRELRLLDSVHEVTRSRPATGRMKVLRRLGHIDGEDVVQLKGRAACELDTADELLATELMFNGVFQNLDAHHLVALVSCLVPVENTKSEVRVARCAATLYAHPEAQLLAKPQMTSFRIQIEMRIFA